MFMFAFQLPTIRLMALATVSLSLMLAVEDAPRAAPPATPEHDVVENYHGRQVPDPYRWLEQAGSPAVEQWIDAQNAYTDAVMSGFQDHGAIIKRAGQLALTSTQRSNPQSSPTYYFTCGKPRRSRR